jgi:MFS family permease
MAMRISTRVAIASAIGNAVGMQAALRVIFALFLAPVSEGLKITRTQYLASAAAGPIATALAAFFVGRLVDRYGPRRVLIPGLIAFSAAEMALSLMSPSPVVMTALWLVFGLAAATQAPTGYVKAISGWFEEKRGLALGLALGVGSGVGAAVATVVVASAMAFAGWRAAFLTLGALPLFVGVPALLWGMRDPVGAPEVGQPAFSPAAKGMSGAAARRTTTFWLILTAILLHQVVLSGMATQQGAVLEGLGIGPTGVGLFVGVFGISFALGQAILGWVMDRFDSPRVGIPFFAAGLIGILFFHYVLIDARATSVPLLFLTALLFGIGSGAELALQAYYVGRYFGQRAAGELFALLLVVFVLSGAVGSILFAATFNATGSYALALSVGEGMLVLGILLIALLKPYTFDVRGEPVARSGQIGEPAHAN